MIPVPRWFATVHGKTRRRQRELAYRIAYFIEDYDPYGFRDNLETGESRESGIDRAAEYAYKEMLEGNYDELISTIYDPDLDDPLLKTEMDLIVSSLRDLETLSQPVVAKNLLKRLWRH